MKKCLTCFCQRGLHDFLSTSEIASFRAFCIRIRPHYLRSKRYRKPCRPKPNSAGYNKLRLKPVTNYFWISFYQLLLPVPQHLEQHPLLVLEFDFTVSICCQVYPLQNLQSDPSVEVIIFWALRWISGTSFRDEP